jgi:hypothetical protein
MVAWLDSIDSSNPDVTSRTVSSIDETSLDARFAIAATSAGTGSTISARSAVVGAIYKQLLDEYL